MYFMSYLYEQYMYAHQKLLWTSLFTHELHTKNFCELACVHMHTYQKLLWISLVNKLMFLKVLWVQLKHTHRISTYPKLASNSESQVLGTQMCTTTLNPHILFFSDWTLLLYSLWNKGPFLFSGTLCPESSQLLCLPLLADSPGFTPELVGLLLGNTKGLQGHIKFIHEAPLPVCGQKLYKGYCDRFQSPRSCILKWPLTPQSGFWSCHFCGHLLLPSH